MIADPGTETSNIESSPSVSVGVFAPYTGWLSVKGAQITGRAKMIAEGDPERGRELSVYRWKKSMGELGITEPPRHAMLKIEAEKIELTDISLKINGYSAKQVCTRLL